MNVIVGAANNGMMPVASKTEDVLFVIGHPSLGTEYFLPANAYRDIVTHQPMRPEMKYLLLSDRIPVEEIWNSSKELPTAIDYYLRHIMQYPYDNDALVSLGDLGIWVGTILWSFGLVSLFATATRFHYLKRSNKLIL